MLIQGSLKALQELVIVYMKEFFVCSNIEEEGRK